MITPPFSKSLPGEHSHRLVTHDTQVQRLSPVGSQLLLFAAYGIFLIVLSIDLVLLLDTPLLAEARPRFEDLYFYRTALLALASAAFVIAIASLGPTTPVKGSPAQPFDDWLSWGTLTISTTDVEKRTFLSIPVKKLIVWGLSFLSLVFLLLFLFRPRTFYFLGKEDRIIEILSAVFALVSGGIFFRLFLALRQRRTSLRIFHLALPLAFAVMFFLLGMEELSWFQRVFAIDTPGILEGNRRHELNLHNFATDEAENLYYLSAFVLLIVLPFVHDKTSIFEKFKSLSLFIPSRFILFISAIPMAYNYDMWNIVFTQLCFFTTLFILLHYIWLEIQRRPPPYLLLSLLVVVAMSQALFLLFGTNFVRIWDVTEYKELFIPISFLFYALEMWGKTIGAGRPVP